jgi:hypothetical protein
MRFKVRGFDGTTEFFLRSSWTYFGDPGFLGAIAEIDGLL